MFSSTCTEHWPRAHSKTRHKVGHESFGYNREASTDPSHAWAGLQPGAGFMCWLRTERKQKRGAQTGTLPKGRRVLWSWQDAASSFLSVSQVAADGMTGADERDGGLPVAACARNGRTLREAWRAGVNIRGQPSSSAPNPSAFLLFASKRLHKCTDLMDMKQRHVTASAQSFPGQRRTSGCLFDSCHPWQYDTFQCICADVQQQPISTRKSPWLSSLILVSVYVSCIAAFLQLLP